MAYKIGLALGGGGARGFAHIGVLKVMEKEHIPIDQITGCSIGAIIGGLYAYFRSVEKVEAFIREIIKKPIFKELNLDVFSPAEQDTFMHTFLKLKRFYTLIKSIKTQSVFEPEIIEKVYEPFPDVPIETLPIPFATIATDLISGREIVINRGSLKTAIMASAAIPGVFPPVPLEDMLLIDGAASDSIPVNVVRGQGVKFVVAVDVSHCLGDVQELDTGLQIVQRADEIVSFHLSRQRLSGADLIIRPAVRHYSWADVRKMKEIILAGEEAAMEQLNILKRFANHGQAS